MPPSAEALRFALLTRFLKGEAKVPQMPEAALRIRRLLQDSRTSLEQLARVINSDPPLAAYLMQFAESPLLRRGRPCVSMRDLLARLGTRQLGDLVLGFGVRHLFASREPALQQAFRLRWRKARERAAYCAALAQRCGLSLDEAMLAGLLEDIGSLPLLAELEHWPDFPRDAQALDELCEYLAGDIGALVLTRWQLPGAIIECARQRGKWQRLHDGTADLTDLVLVASALQAAPQDLAEPLPAQQRLNLQQPLAALREELQAELQLWLRLLA
ncbi:HDOD domain-containing protein [Pseudomonas sp. R-28-1W-6]|uniref:HDOD domain-containing protein n=1 Tax=Pseudomonas sp. R-28-1W-6 TaxID=2650101 RepID=UPI0013657DCE|nr:HDOD domain-containing protein [Pseudomonas sp. R-28-1W-6]MWV13260.1 HDOD domain-containing protein [Pseudomonas sp. R-28-1W-6]